MINVAVLKHRTDIDGLRAVAILPVVLYHAGLGWLPGGFVGVDIFFVISGFLITRLITQEMNAGDFSLARFYARRARRILPALVLVLGTTFLMGLLVLTPREMRDLGKMILATSLFSSNLALWTQSGYFDAAAELKPLLMTWSLGIEEQFYVFWPLVLLALVKLKVSPRTATTTLGLASFALACWWTSEHPSAAFYLLPSRAWEMLLGAALTLAGRHPRASHSRWTGSAMRDCASIAGATSILVSVTLLDQHAAIPGWAAILPCGGAALLIWAGEDAVMNRRLLSSKPMILIGLISYSLYLWHWPILTIARICVGPEGMSAMLTTVLVLVAFAISAISWKFVEQPFRRGPSQEPFGVLSRYGATVAIFLAVGVVTLASAGFPARVTSELVAEPVPRADSPVSASTCANPSASHCQSSSKTRVVALWGDSQALAFAPGVKSWAANRGQAFLLRTHNSCPPLLNTDVVFDRRPFAFCRQFNDGVIKEIAANPDISLVVLVARWAWYTETTDFVFSRHSAHLADETDSSLSPRNSKRAFAAALNRSTAALTAAGKRVLLVAQVPELGFDVPACYTRQGLQETFFKWPVCSPKAAAVRQRLEFTDNAISSFAGHDNLVSVLLPSRLTCAGGTCRSLLNDRLLYSDDNHLSPFGAAYLADQLDTALDLESSSHPRAVAAKTGS